MNVSLMFIFSGNFQFETGLLESTKVIGSLLVIIHRFLGLDPRQEPHTCNIHLSCSLRKLCHENY